MKANLPFFCNSFEPEGCTYLTLDEAHTFAVFHASVRLKFPADVCTLLYLVGAFVLFLPRNQRLQTPRS